MLTSSVRPGTVCDVMEELLDMGDTGIMVTRAIALTLVYCPKVFRRWATETHLAKRESSVRS